ncbi:MAG TPA: phosphoribosylanthranilate isomerase [Acidimicrobiales bacterium]|nr:phosphoribosylanthranilate isomerase [Acidimicrobiales bacterium]
MTTEEDALIATAMGADAVGFIFAPSPRQVSVAHVAKITTRLPPEIITVGVFRDEHPERVVEIVFEAGLRAAQLHGHETVDDIVFVASHVRHVIKAYAANSTDLARSDQLPVEAILVDGHSPGSGKVFDWRLVEKMPRSRHIILAGGLNAENVGDAIRRVRPWGVDVSTSLESSPGVKDPTKVRAFIKAARTAAPDDDATDRPGGLGSLSDGPYDWQEDD